MYKKLKRLYADSNDSAYKNLPSISFFVNYLKEGGGPMGYTYNLKIGFTELNIEDFKINFYETELKFNMQNYSLLNRLQRKLCLLKKHKILKDKIINSDICIFQGFQETYLIKYAKKIKKPIVYMPHSPSIMADEKKMTYELNNRKFSKKDYKFLFYSEQLFFQNADYFVFPSENSFSAYETHWGNYINQKKVFFIKSGTIIRKKTSYSINIFSNLKCDKFIIAFIGRYVTHKGFDVFCKVAELLKENPEIQFVCAGSGPLEKIIPANLLNLGFINDIGNLIELCDIVVIPNKVTYYDLLPIECAAYGKALIFSDNGGNIDQARDFKDSLIFRTNSTDSLKEKILEGIEIKKNNNLFGTANEKVYNSEFTEIALAERWSFLLRKLIQEKCYE